MSGITSNLSSLRIFVAPNKEVGKKPLKSCLKKPCLELPSASNSSVKKDLKVRFNDYIQIRAIPIAAEVMKTAQISETGQPSKPQTGAFIRKSHFRCATMRKHKSE